MSDDSFASTFSNPSDDTPRWEGAESFLKEFSNKRQAVIDEFDEAQQRFISALTAVHAEYAKGEDPLPSFEQFYQCLTILTRLRISVLAIGNRVYFKDDVAALALEVLAEVVHTETGWPLWSEIVPSVTQLMNQAQLSDETYTRWWDEHILGAVSSHASLARAESRVLARLN